MLMRMLMDRYDVYIQARNRKTNKITTTPSPIFDLIAPVMGNIGHRTERSNVATISIFLEPKRLFNLGRRSRSTGTRRIQAPIMTVPICDVEKFSPLNVELVAANVGNNSRKPTSNTENAP